MKRFFSLMLVALLLVSVMPFQAFATEGHAHSWKEIKNVPATCDTDGSVTHECQNKEGCTYETNNYQRVTVVPKLGHSGNPVTVVKEPTCSAKGLETQTCARCGEVIGEWEIDIDPTKHQRDNGTVTTDAKCGENGVKEYKCALCGEAMGTEAVEALEHNYVGVVTTNPTCGAAGVKTFTCSHCSDPYTETVDPTGLHSFNHNGVCECGAKESDGGTADAYMLKVNYLNANGVWTHSMISVKQGGTITLPEIPSVSGKRHTGWNTLKNGAGDSIEEGDKWYNGMYREFFATYVESTDDGLVDLTVYAHYYVGGVYHHKEKLFVKSFKESKSNNMHNWLYSDAGMSQTRAALAEQLGADGYQWDPEKYYDYFDSREATESDLVADGDKSVFIKVGSKKEIEATVLLHVHTSKTRTIDRTINMDGYTADDYISKPEALSAVKKYYTGNNIEIGDLYIDTEWENLLDGKKSEGGYSVKIEDNGTTEIHVILKNATAKNNNADPSNPKTGDYIMIAVGTMVLAAAAVVTLAELKKRKMI